MTMNRRSVISVLTTPLPTDPGDLTLDILNQVIAAENPRVTLTAFEVAESHVWGGGNASSAGRCVLVPTYAEASGPGLPRKLVIKVARGGADDPRTPNPVAGAGGALYHNEVEVYRRLRPSDFLEAPATLGGAYDPSSNALMLVMEDLREREASFASVKVPTGLARMRSLLDQLAILHARFWQGPELERSLAWMESHTRGRIHDQFNAPEVVPRFIAHQVATEQFKSEMVERLGTDPDGLFRQFQRVQRHQATLPQTVCHGDTHIGNTYILPGERAGLLDWQLACKGFAMHDVSYAMATALSVAQRRQHERELLGYYRERLLANGLAEVPSADALWCEYRRAIVWGVYIGWLTTPVVNYGWEITVLNHLRLMTAYEDLETAKSIASLE
jgi:hypothetical protein